jgi:hypothetical protein
MIEPTDLTGGGAAFESPAHWQVEGLRGILLLQSLIE